MFPLMLVLATLGGVFGSGQATGTQTSASQMQIELVVEAPAGGSVVAHLIEPGGTQRVVAMSERSPGTYGAVFEERRVNYLVVFEAVGQGQSSAHTLIDLGLDPSVLGIATEYVPTTAAEVAVTENRWGWLSLAAGAAALSLIAFRAMGSRDEEANG